MRWERGTKPDSSTTERPPSSPVAPFGFFPFLAFRIVTLSCRMEETDVFEGEVEGLSKTIVLN